MIFQIQELYIFCILIRFVVSKHFLLFYNLPFHFIAFKRIIGIQLGRHFLSRCRNFSRDLCGLGGSRYTCMHVEAKDTLSCHPSSTIHCFKFVFDTRFLCGLQHASPGIFCLCLHNSGMTSVCPHTCKQNQNQNRVFQGSSCTQQALYQAVSSAKNGNIHLRIIKFTL